jgi:hypothetical protein
MFIGISISMVLTYFYAVGIGGGLWPLYPSLGTFGLALLGTILFIISRRENEKPSDKIKTLDE